MHHLVVMAAAEAAVKAAAAAEDKPKSTGGTFVMMEVARVAEAEAPVVKEVKVVLVV